MLVAALVSSEAVAKGKFTTLAAVVVGADGKATRVNPTPPVLPGQAARKFGRRAVDPAALPAPAPTPAPSPSNPIVTGTAEMPGEKEFNSCKKFPSGKRVVKLNMKPDTELGDLLSWISSITCKQFLLPGTIPANSKKVTIIAPQLITPEEAYRLFLASLDSVGLTVEPSGKFLRIIETLRAKSTSIPVYGPDGDMPAGENYVTRLVRVENGDVNELATVLTRVKGEQGDIVPYVPQSALIITDRATNIDRMMRILKEIDQPGGSGEKVWVVTVHNTAASEMAQKLADIFQVQQLGGRRGGAPAPAPAPGQKARGTDLASELNISKIIPDERSNQLIVIATDRAYARVLMLVKKLDVPIEGGDGRIHVYYCENANCDELAATLGAVTGIAVSGAAGGRSRTRGGQPTPTPTPTPTPAGGQQGKENLLFEGEVRINFDRPTNSLIVVSSLKDYQSLRRVIERLDSPRKQVFVEAMILEVTVDKERDLGAAWHAAKPQNLFGLNDPSLIVAGLNPTKTIFPAASLSETMLAGVLGPVLSPEQARSLGTASTTTIDIPQFGVLIKALQTNSDVDVLSNPHLLIMNNEEGEISVGQRIPFPVSTLGLGAAAGATGAAGLGALGGLGVGGLFPQVQREKVALEMKLTPHVNEHDIIRLEVDEKISEVAPGASNLGPSTSERTAKTIVVAKDQQTILIGGLMSDKVINSVTKIPILGDIPVLGFFFRNTTKHVVKTNLIIALTPYVVNDQSDLRRILEKKMKERREFVERFGGEDRKEFNAIEDYRRKRGMLEEINRAAREIQREEDEIEQIRISQAMDESGPLEPAMLPKPPPAAGKGTGAPPPAGAAPPAGAPANDNGAPPPAASPPSAPAQPASPPPAGGP
ncbi:MAG TPA: type II secretion system secretin GspD [Polyangia bacterium]|nr:type II secretion system secretin GspD [Polyangia bacterium]